MQVKNTNKNTVQVKQTDLWYLTHKHFAISVVEQRQLECHKLIIFRALARPYIETFVKEQNECMYY